MPSYDVVVYGANFSACISAIVAARGGLTVGLIAPETVLGGMITGGLGITDAAVTKNWYGVTEDFIDAVKAETGWTVDRLTWNFPPSEAQVALDALVAAESNISLHLGEVVTEVTRTEDVSTVGRLDTALDRGKSIKSITTDAAATYEAEVFIDGSYTGELMHVAGVPYDLGREPRSLYGEPNAGVVTDAAVEIAIDFTDADGDLMKFAQFAPAEAPGDGDRKTMGGGFRYCVTNVVANMVPWPAPPGYDAADFEQEILWAQRDAPLIREIYPGLFFRRAIYDDAEAALHLDGYALMTQSQREAAWHTFTAEADMAASPGKYLTNGSDIIGPLPSEYTEASEARRAEIRDQLMYRELGRFYTFANNPAVPVATRDSFSSVGFCADEFQTDFIGVAGFPHEYYHRQGRRLRGQDRVEFWETAYQVNYDDQIAFGGYFVDSKAKTQYSDGAGGTLREGPYRDGHFTTSDDVEREWEAAVYFGIPMGAVLAPRGVCDNLIVVWSLSASDVAFTSIRLEPFLAAVAEAAGHMAIEAVSTATAPALLSYTAVRTRLDAAGADLYRYEVPA